jgi:hypothetical protein
MSKQLSGQTTVTTAGTAVVLGTGVINDALIVKAFATNSGLIYVGNDGVNDVTSTNGFVLSAGNEVRFELVGRLEDIYVDSSVNGQKVSWIVLNV